MHALGRLLGAGLVVVVSGCDGGDDDGSNDQPAPEAQAWRTLGHTTKKLEVEGHELDGRSQHGALSAGGRYLTFSSLGSNVVMNDANGVTDVFIRDLKHGESVELLSVNLEGVAGNGESFGASASADGRYVAFTSGSSDLVPDDTNDVFDVFVRDLHTGITQRASVGPGGEQANFLNARCYLSADGSTVAFLSGASNLVPDDENGEWDVFVHNHFTGITELVSVASDDTQGNGESKFSGLSADARFVTFMSGASNFAEGDTNGVDDVFLRDRLLGTTERISESSDGHGANGMSAGIAVSPDGRFVAFGSLGSNLVPNDHNNTLDVFIRDRLEGTTERVNVASDGSEANAISYWLTGLGADGRLVAFTSRATNLAPGTPAGQWNLFLRDRLTGTTTLAVPGVGGPANGETALDAIGPAMSFDGRFLAFEATASNVVDGDDNQNMDVFVRDLQEQISVRASVGELPTPAPVAPAVLDPADYLVVESYPQGRVLAAAPSVTDKAQLLFSGPPTNVPLGPVEARRMHYNAWIHADDFEGSDLAAYVEAYLKVPFFGRTQSLFTLQRTYVAWLGSGPFAADTVFHTDEWIQDLTPHSPDPIVTGAPPGAVVQARGDVIWQTEVDDNWFSQHEWDGLKMQTQLFYRTRLVTTGTFQFGSSFYVVTAQAASST